MIPLPAPMAVQRVIPPPPKNSRFSWKLSQFSSVISMILGPLLMSLRDIPSSANVSSGSSSTCPLSLCSICLVTTCSMVLSIDVTLLHSLVIAYFGQSAMLMIVFSALSTLPTMLQTPGFTVVVVVVIRTTLHTFSGEAATISKFVRLVRLVVVVVRFAEFCSWHGLSVCSCFTQASTSDACSCSSASGASVWFEASWTPTIGAISAGSIAWIVVTSGGGVRQETGDVAFDRNEFRCYAQDIRGSHIGELGGGREFRQN